MKWSRFFVWVLALLVAVASIALVRYGVPEWLDGLTLMWVANCVLFICAIGLGLPLVILRFKPHRRIDEGLVRQRLGAFYYVFWGVFMFSALTYLAITLRYASLRTSDLERHVSHSQWEMYSLFSAMSGLFLALLFASGFVMSRFIRYIADENAGASGDQ